MEKLIQRVMQSKPLTLSLHIYSHACVVLSALLLIFIEYRAFRSSPTDAIFLAVSLALPFVLVSVLRIVINAPRPYEVLDIFDTPPKGKSGRSFPSRHAFSIFAISVSAFAYAPPLAVAGIILGLGLCVARVALGIHFIRDVAAGALIGVATAAIGLIIL